MAFRDPASPNLLGEPSITHAHALKRLAALGYKTVQRDMRRLSETKEPQTQAPETPADDTTRTAEVPETPDAPDAGSALRASFAPLGTLRSGSADTA